MFQCLCALDLSKNTKDLIVLFSMGCFTICVTNDILMLHNCSFFSLNLFQQCYPHILKEDDGNFTPIYIYIYNHKEQGGSGF